MSKRICAWVHNEFGLADIEVGRSIVSVATFALAVGFVIAMSAYHDNLNSDTIMVYLAALIRWTPFFWGQDRYGMIIPALTLWITDPLANIVVQNALHVACTVASFFLLARVLFPHVRWKLVGSLGLLAYVSLSGLREVEDFLTPWQIYSPAMVFALGAMIVGERRLVAALILASIGEWCNFSVFLITGSILAVREFDRFGREGRLRVTPELLRQAVVIGVSTAVGNVLRTRLANGGPSYEILRSLDAIRGWVYMVYDFATEPRSHWALLVLPMVLGLALIGHAVARAWPRLVAERMTLRRFVASLVVAFGYAMVVGSNTWAQFNGFPRRYLIPSLMIWAVAWAAIAVRFLPPFVFASRLARLVPAAAVPIVAMLRFGTPSVDHVSDSLAAAMAKRYAEVPAECTHVAGDYYRVWPAVLYARLVRGPTLWGLSYRREVTADLWDPGRFARPVGCFWVDNEAEGRHFLGRSGFALYTDTHSRGPMNLVTRP